MADGVITTNPRDRENPPWTDEKFIDAIKDINKRVHILMAQIESVNYDLVAHVKLKGRPVSLNLNGDVAVLLTNIVNFPEDD